jgi:hypothetical protein
VLCASATGGTSPSAVPATRAGQWHPPGYAGARCSTAYSGLTIRGRISVRAGRLRNLEAPRPLAAPQSLGLSGYPETILHPLSGWVTPALRTLPMRCLEPSLSRLLRTIRRDEHTEGYSCGTVYVPNNQVTVYVMSYLLRLGGLGVLHTHAVDAGRHIPGSCPPLKI